MPLGRLNVVPSHVSSVAIVAFVVRLPTLHDKCPGVLFLFFVHVITSPPDTANSCLFPLSVYVTVVLSSHTNIPLFPGFTQQFRCVFWADAMPAFDVTTSKKK